MALLVSTTSGNWSTAGNWTVANTGVVSGAAPTNADEVAIHSSLAASASASNGKYGFTCGGGIERILHNLPST
jgi:hypothetical protein